MKPKLELDNVDFRLLKAFLVLTAELNVTNASVRLNVTQSSMSQTLGRLRTLFDDPLLLKIRGGMVATNRAKELEVSIRRIVSDYTDLMVGLQSFDPKRSSRKFVITASAFAEHILIPPLVRNLRILAPNIDLEIRPPNPDKAFELLESGEVDLRIAWTLTPQASLRSMQLFQDRLVCIVNEYHPEVQGELSIEQFIRLPHVRSLGAVRTTSVRVVDEALKKIGQKLITPITLQDVFTGPILVASTDIISTVPKTLALMLSMQHKLQILELPLRLPRIKYSSYWHEKIKKILGTAGYGL